MTELDDDIVSLFTKRVYDIAGTTAQSLKVWFNGNRLKLGKGFQTYVDMYLPKDNTTTPKVYLKLNDRWEVCLSMTDGHFQQVSFVNNICTIKGGRHVQVIQDQITKAICEHITKKHKGVNVKSHQVKNYLWIFVNSLIENPAFDSQTKDTLTTKKSSFGSSCTLPDNFIKQVIKSGVVENLLEWAKFKQNKDLKKNDGKKKSRINGIPKLDDANDAGGKKGHECTLILTEGDSAKALAASGLSVLGRDKYGIFPLRGKLLNVREANHKQIMANAEITQLKQIVGLQTGKNYTDTKSLRYGHIMIMTDQDHDGSHIKGLVINLFSHFWPSLLKMPGFLTEFITPIVKVTKGKQDKVFYTIPEYEQWKEAHNDGKGWRIKYYKGLGTSTAKEAKVYFSNLERHKIDFTYEGEEDEKNIDMAFSRKKANARKAWIGAYDGHSYLDQDVASIGYTDFINKELILFSIASNQRSIPSIMDGLKPGQRKILYSCFKRKLTKEIKVVQLAGYVSEHSAYHHGEASLTSTIVNLAQPYVGSNNINLLMPNGQFGTRHQGGKDAASSRYIFTNLSPMTRAMFHEADDAILEPLNDDGQLIEPAWYVPVIPMVLVNGAAGIGTGWSTNIPNYNPRQLVNVIKQKINGEEPEQLVPWYKNFKGTITKSGAQKFNVDGTIEQLTNLTFKITELPIEKWTLDYKISTLEQLVEKGKLKEFREYHTDMNVEFLVEFASEEQLMAADQVGLHEFFKLRGSVCTSNMVLHTADGPLKKYETELEIVDDFYTTRLDCYYQRKQHLTETLEMEVKRVSNKVRFILAVINDELNIRNVPKKELLEVLREEDYDPMPKTKKKKATEEDEDSEEAQEASTSASDFDYLLSMPMWNLTKEKVDLLKAEKEDKEQELEILIETTPEQLWIDDLDLFLEQLDECEAAEQKQLNDNDALAKKASRGKAKKSRYEDDDDDFCISKPKSRKKKAAPKKKEDPLIAQFTTLTINTAPKPTVLKEKVTRKKKAAPAPEPKSPKEVEKVNKIVRKAKVEISDFEASDEEEPEVEVIAPRKTNSRKARKPVKYVESEEEEKEEEEEASGDESEEYVEEKKPKAKASAKPKSRAKSAPAKRAAKKPSKAVEEKEDDSSDDEEALSLAERVSKRMGNLLVDESSSYRKATISESAPIVEKEESEEDTYNFDMEPSPVKAKPAKKQTKRSRKAKTKTPPAKATKSRVKKDVVDLVPSPAPIQKKRRTQTAKAIRAIKEDKSDEEPVEKPAVKKGRKAPTKKAAKKPVAKKAAPKRKPKKVVSSDEEDDDEDSGSDFGALDSPITKKTPRPSRRRQAVCYAESDDEDDDSDFSDY